MKRERITKELHFSQFVSPDWSLHIHFMNSLRLRAVLYREDGLWIAHALEMDLIGTGATESAALRELRRNVDAQFSFATQEGKTASPRIDQCVVFSKVRLQCRHCLQTY
ncbi:MAG: hypothetical protein HC767_08360 [Akkermansiaceae bacterium]|nr:hypothetical protein [Akkermansiaceae bacterium]